MDSRAINSRTACFSATLLIALLSMFVVSVSAQGNASSPDRKSSNDAAATPAQTATPQKSSAAYAEVLLRKTELQADLESLLIQYTDDYPKVNQARYELDLVSREVDRLLAVKPSDVAKLTAALGKMIVRKVELQRELWTLQQQLGDSHPDVKRAKRKVEIYESAIKEILG